MASPAGIFLAIDQSTSATKVMLFHADGRLLDQEWRAHRQIYTHPGWVEHDAEQIYTNTLEAAAALLSRHADLWNGLTSLSITNQRETFVVFDRATGRPLHNAIVWQCRRGVEICRQLVEGGHERLVHELTGLKIDTYFPASKLRWLLDEQPDLRARIEDGTALFGTMDTYLIYRLTGGDVYATDHTNASRTLLFDIGALTWSQELSDVFGLKISALPEVRESSAWYGDTDLAGCLNRRIPICGVMGDSQAALFAQRCFAPGSVKVTLGTGSSILINVGHEKRLSESGTLTALGWVIDGQPTYALEGIVNFTGATISWLRDQMQLIADPAQAEAIARSVPDSGGVYLIPAFVGLSAPYWRADARAAIVGMTPSTTRAHVVRAALESIAFIITDVLKAMEKDAGIALRTVFADGGAARNSFLLQFLADLNGMTVRAAGISELSALGAVFSGGLGQKVYASLEDIIAIPMQYSEYLPQVDAGAIDQLSAGWQTAVQQILYRPLKG